MAKAEFEVELEDDVSAPARKMGGALGKLRTTLTRLRGVGASIQKIRSGGGAIRRILFGEKVSRDLETGRFVKGQIGLLGKLRNLMSGSSASSGGFLKDAIAHAAGGLMQRAIENVGAFAAKIASATVGMADFGQRSRIAFGLLAKEGENAEQLFRQSTDLAADLGLDIKDTTKQIQKFRALQFSQKQAEALIRMGADMQSLGASTEETSRIFAQLGQIQAKGRLQGEELIVLAENGLSTGLVLDALAKRLGKTREEVQKLVSAGKVGSSDALNAIGEAILAKTGTKEFGQAGKKIADSTISGVVGQLKARGQLALLRIGDALAPALSDTVKKGFTAFNEFLSSKEGQNFIDGIGKTLARVATALGDAIPLVKQFLAGFGEGAGATIKLLADAFKDLFGGVNKDGSNVGAILRSLGQSIGTIVILAGAVGAAFAAIVAGVTLATNFLARFGKSVWDSIIGSLGQVIFGISNWFANLSAIFNAEGLSLGEKALAIGKQIVMGLVNGIKALAMLPIQHMKNIANGAINAAKSVLGIASPSKVFEGIGENVAMGFERGAQMPTMAGITGNLANDNGMQQAVGAAVGGTEPGGRSGGDVHVHLTVQAAPGATEQDGKQFGDGIAKSDLISGLRAIVLQEAV